MTTNTATEPVSVIVERETPCPPTGTGTRLRTQHSEFRQDQRQAYQGARYGWQRFFGALEKVLARTD
jgi:hypothetical protein